MMSAIPTTRTGIAMRKTVASFALMDIAIINAKMNINGERTAILIIIINVFWTFVTSVVSLVTREAVENLSTLAKEKSCTLSKSFFLTFFAKPIPA